VLACAAAASSASAAVPRSFWGVSPINTLDGEEIQRMGAGNVGTMRLLTLWPAVETKRDSHYWGYLDFIVASAAVNGIEVLPFVYGTPKWVKGVRCHGLSDELCLRVPPLGSADARTQWQQFLGELVGRYGPHGSFWSDTSDVYDPPFVPITRWQVWNEPSSQTYYQPRPSPRGYARLVKLSDAVITATDPGAEVVLAGLFPAPEGGKAFRLEPFLRDFYKARGIGKHYDSAALHPYARTVNGLRNQIEKVRGVMRRAGVAGKPLWVTEVGWGSDPPGPDRPLVKGEDGQQRLLERSFGLLADRRNDWKLAGVIWYAWRDPGHTYENCTFCSSAGLLRTNGNPKPSWHSYVKFTGGSPDLPPEQPPPPAPPPDDDGSIIPPILPGLP
jgi:Glycosyl hydrolase catalytic core